MLKLSRWRISPDADERGSVIIVIVLIAVLSLAVAALLGTVQSGLQSSRADQDRTDAFQRANGGIDHALYRFDRNDLPTSVVATASSRYDPTTPVEAGVFNGFTETVNVAGATYRIEARPSEAGQTARWTVNSTGCRPTPCDPAAPPTGRTVRLRQAVATIEPERLFKDGFFTLNGFDLRGNPFTPVAYDSKVHVSPEQSQITGVPLPVSMGTNGSITGSRIPVERFAARWMKMNMYGRADQAVADAACVDCGGAPKVVPHTDQQKIITVPVPTGPTPPAAQSCPAGGIIRNLTIAPGDYVCNDLIFGGNVHIGTGGNGTGIVRFWATETLNFDGNAKVNTPPSWCQPPKPPSTATRCFSTSGAPGGLPTKMQIFYDIPANLADQNNSKMCGTSVHVFALLYTPGLVLKCPGASQPAIYGAIVANVYLNTGGPQFDFFWDRQSTNILHTSKYRVVDWRECPVGATSC
jgi:hypothetical protein